ncbi:hypothetical protein [Tropicimonas sp. S265A]|uniref:hypothetical protein n=1 Tax=Tropicimonas sp. S265A TaxID=3415134 RepID=UPI003C7DF743
MADMFAANTMSNILSLREEEVAEFLRDAMTSKRLSTIVKHLNSELLDGAPESKEKASAALTRLGFVA